MTDPRNREVAERVFGMVECNAWESGNMGSAGGPVLWKRCDHPDGKCWPATVLGSIAGPVGGVPNFLSDDHAFGMLLDEVARQGWKIDLKRSQENVDWIVHVWHPVQVSHHFRGHVDRRTALVEAVLAAYRAKEEK